MKDKNYRMKLYRAALVLLLLLVTTTPAWAIDIFPDLKEFTEKTQDPIGYLDVVEVYPGCIHVAGWTCDPYKVRIYWRTPSEKEWKNRIFEAHTVVNNSWWEESLWWLCGGTSCFNWVAKQNQVEIHLQQNDKDKYVFTYDMNEKRPDAEGYILSLDVAYQDYVHKDDVQQIVNKVNFGFDYLIEGIASGDYTVVAYGTNVHGNQGKVQLTNGKKNISVSIPFTIAYDANGGSGPMPPTQPKNYHETITLSSTIPTREGYTFMGWNTEPGSDGTHYNPGDTYAIDASITLYAQWVRTSFYNSYATIRTVEDWNDLATMVNNGRNLRGLFYSTPITLANDIGDDTPITRCIGTQQYPFGCEFFGDNHSINVNINDTRHEGTAPFRVVAVTPHPYNGDSGSQFIVNLKVKGTVRGGKYCAGVVGISHGAIVRQCVVQADIITGSTVCGGVMGYADAKTVDNYCRVEDTHFSGTIRGATQTTGVFIGDCREGRDGRVNSCLATGTVSGANIAMGHNCKIIDTYKTFNFGQQGTYKPYDAEALVKTMGSGWDYSGYESKWCLDDDRSILPYHRVYIDKAADWDNIATRLANGVSFKGRQLILRNDITVSTMLGTEEHPFDGSFDGQNKTLTFNLTTDESGCAPFRYIKDAEIMNLRIRGTLEHSVAGQTRLAGLAAYTSGNNTVTNCTVNSTIRSLDNALYLGGFVAQINDGRVKFNSCCFKGKLLGGENSRASAGFVAINLGTGTSFSNSIFAPSECTVGTTNSCTICRDIKQSSKISSTYYKQPLGYEQGTRVYTNDMPDNLFCRRWKGPDNANYYLPSSTSVSGLQSSYNYYGGNPIDISYTLYCKGKEVTADKYTATITKATDGTEVTEVTDMGSYVLSVTANEDSGYHGTVQRTFYVTASALAMNNVGHFLIKNADDWNTLCDLAGGEHFQEYQYFGGRIVELTTDITVNRKLPIFCGTLAGNGHTLTFNYGTAQTPAGDYAAPIHNLSGDGLVENLHVSGTIYSNGGLCGGIAAIARDNARIRNCRSSIRIKSTHNGQCYNGGLVGQVPDGKLTISNCLFDGCFTSEDTEHVKATHWAGFVGDVMPPATVSINSCLYYSNIYERKVPSEHNATFYLPTDASSVSLQNCCHTEPNLVNSQGTYVAFDSFREAENLIPALGYEGWYKVFDYPQWQDSYPAPETKALVLPRTDYRTALEGHIEGLQGTGTNSDPYLIGSTQDWNAFANSINNNNVGAEACYQLTEDITIDQSQTVGTTVPYVTVNVQYDEHRTFRGTFDGDGHTLTLNKTTSGNYAPFIYAQDCTIKNLTVDGTLTTNSPNVAGLILNASGTVNITGCRGSLTINSSYTGAGGHGGFVARSSGTTNIDGCVFDGSIIGATTYSCGGFVGSRTSGTVSITGSFFTPAAITLDTDNASDNSATFCRNDATITDCYYTQPVHAGQGTALYSVTAAEGIDMSIGGDGEVQEYSSGITVVGETGFWVDDVFYAHEGAAVPIERLQLMTGYSPLDATIAPNAGTYAGGTLTMPAQNVVFTTSTPIALSTYTIRFDANGGTGDAMADMNLTYGDDPVELTANTYTRTANGFTGWNTAPGGSGTAYTDGQTVENLTTVSGAVITLYAQWKPWITEGFGKTDSYTPDGTEEHPYIISSAEEWNLLCDYIGSGKGDLASAHYRLGNNLTVSRMMGTEANPFRGTFEGNQCTLTLDLTGVDPVEVESVAPDDSENIEDPEGMEYPEDQQGSQSIELPDDPNNQTEDPEDNGLQALAPFAYVDGATIKNLRTTGTIYGESRFFAGGIVGMASGSTTLQSCHSSVVITSTATETEGEEESGQEDLLSPMFGGIVGQSSGSLRFTDCLFDGTINAENTSHCGGFLGQHGGGGVTFTNCLMAGELNCKLDGCGTFYQSKNPYVVYSFNNSYYHTAYGESQGTQTNDTGEALRSSLGSSWAVTDEEAVVPFINIRDLANAKIILSSPAYPDTGSPIDVGYTVKDIRGDVLEENTDYAVTIKNAEGTELTEVTELGEYILTVNGTGEYVGSKSIYFYVYESDGTPFPLDTDEDFESYEDGYFYVRMPRTTEEWRIYGDWSDVWHDAEDNPRIVNIPAGFTRCFKVYDDGGKQRMGEGPDGGETELGSYDFGGEPKTLTLTCPEGFCFSVQGTMKTPKDHPFTIYDGNAVGNGGVLLDHATRERSVGPFITSGNSITFYLDAAENWGMDVDGFDLTARVVPQVPPTYLANDDSQWDWGEKKNTWVITANDGEQINVTIDGRTLYRDGTWNTLCLPFDIPNIAYTPLRGAAVKALNSTNYSDGTLTLGFSHNLTSLEAGKPYVVKWNASDTKIHYTDLQGSGSLIDNNEESSWYVTPGENGFCEFFTSEPMDVSGYTLAYFYNEDELPTKWTLKGKLDENDTWTLLDSRDVIANPDDMLSAANYISSTTYNLATSGTYRYFRFDVLEGRNEYSSVNLTEFKLIGEPVLEDIVNPTFRGVTIKDELHPAEVGGFSFQGNYSSLASTDGLLLDAHNAGGNAFHATFGLPDVTLYTDAEHMTPVTEATAIPFAADGTVTLYYTQSDLALTLHDDDSQAAENEKNASLIEENNGKFAIVTLDGRTLYKDGTWNTISLPFDLALKGSPLEGATVKALEGASYNDGAMTLDFSDVGGDLQSPTIEAGKPYIVKWEHVDFPAVNPSENLLNNLGFIGEIPTLVYPDATDDAILIDGDTDSQYENWEEPWVEFHYEKPITPTGYALWTADEGDGEYNPASWTILAKNEGDEDWTELVTVDNSNGDKLPTTNSTCTLFELDNSTAYQYFCFTATRTEYYDDYWDKYVYRKIKLSELQFFTARPNTDIVNPVFAGVTIKSEVEESDNIFAGSYTALTNTDGQMLDAHNTGDNAFHAALNLSALDVGSYDFSCYSDAGHTTPAAGVIPFNASDGSVTLYPKWSLTLNNIDSQAAENEKNTDLISSAAEIPIVCDVTLADRKLWKDGDWNTLVLPFSLTSFTGTPLEGAIVKTLDSTAFDAGTLTMNFTEDQTSIKAGIPYIVKWAAQTPDYVERPVFTGVTISDATVNVEIGYVNFVGTYSSVVYDDENKSVLFLGGGSNLYYPDGESAITIGACRAYFTLNSITAGGPNDPSSPVKAFVLNFDGDDPDGIVVIKNEERRIKDEENAGGWYDLSGRKMVNGKWSNGKLPKGIYIHNGRKEVLK